MENYKDYIKAEIKNLEAIEIKEQTIDGQETIMFTIALNKKIFTFIVFHSTHDGLVIIQTFTTFHASYSAPDVEFYQILDEMNLSSVLGNHFFTKEGDNHHISYRSNYLSREDDFNGHSSFKEFLAASVGMIDKYDGELAIL